MGGGPGFTVHRMGGGTPRRRPREAGASEANPSGLAALYQLLPMLLLFVLPLLSSLFTGGSPSGPEVRYDAAVPPRTMQRVTPNYKIPYFVNPAEVQDWNARKFNSLDKKAEVDYISNLQVHCQYESQRRQQEINDATGFFFTDEDRIRRAMNMPMANCKRLKELDARLVRQY